jgi:superfamily II DNA or RNA helicase
VGSDAPKVDIGKRETWPPEVLAAPGAWKTAIEVEQLLELGLAERDGSTVRVPYGEFQAVEEAEIGLTAAWTPGNPYLLKIDRHSDLGRPEFKYKYEFMTSSRPVTVDRIGYYLRPVGENAVFRLDRQAYALVEEMDRFNSLPASAKTQEESWLAFAKVKGCAAEVGAALDRTLQSNSVVVPSSIGLNIYEDETGSITFLPRCPELETADFRQVFERNPDAQGLYSLDRPGLNRVRIVLTEKQREVLRRMKRVRRLTGALGDSVKRDPAQVFDGILDSVELPYADRVIGIGDFEFVPTPKARPLDGGMATLWERGDLGTAQTDPITSNSTKEDARSAPVPPVDDEPTIGTHPGPTPRPVIDGVESAQPSEGTSSREAPQHKFLLIETNEDTIRAEAVAAAERAAASPSELAAFERPRALKTNLALKPHQEEGVSWLQTCCRIDSRRGVLLADDMGLGKTLQVLSFLAWAIESGRLPDVAADAPPYRPILLIVPLILLENRTWESEMERFFENGGSIFSPVLNLHGEKLRWLRADADSPGRETEIGRPILDLDRLQRHRVVITNYETLTNYQHSFAYLRNGKSLWSAIVTDEAQEYKTPNTRVSHAMKALKADFEIASTGTPVENRLLDLWNLFDSIQPGLLLSAQEFRRQFEDPITSGDDDTALANLKKTLLFQKPHAFLLRRNKSEVAELPPKHTHKLKCVMSDQELELHRTLVRNMRGDSGKMRHLAALHDFSHLYQHPALLGSESEETNAADLLAGSSKLRSVLDTLHEIRQRREKAIIFTRHRAMQSILAKVLQNEFGIPIRIVNGLTQRSQGGTGFKSAATRKAILDEFRSRLGFNVLILSPHVAGVGLTITEANHVIHYGRWWNPAVESQATDRVYRIGQTKDVHVYLPILHDPSGTIPASFDERLDTLMEVKYRLAEEFLKPLDSEDQLGNQLCEQLASEETPVAKQ